MKIGKSNRGFTLLEVLVAIGIFAFGLLALATMQTTAITSNSSSASLTVGAALAQGAMEDLMARSSSDPFFTVAAIDTVYDLDPTAAAATRTIEGRTYNATYSVTPNIPATNVTRMDVTVTGGGRAITLTSYKRT